MAPGDLGPGIRRLRPDDHFMVLAETDATPMQIRALIYLATPQGAPGAVFETLRAHLAARLAATPAGGAARGAGGL